MTELYNLRDRVKALEELVITLAVREYSLDDRGGDDDMLDGRRLPRDAHEQIRQVIRNRDRSAFDSD